MLDFSPLWSLMEKKGISANALFRMGFPQTNYYRLKAQKDIRISNLAHLCKLLDCELHEIVKYVPKK
jgi:putative transcriptional regulator